MDEKVLDSVISKCKEYFRTSSEGIDIVREFGNGKSGNGVFLLEVKDSKDSTKIGKYVLKVSCNIDDDFLDEIVNTIELSRIQENLSDIHFPNYEYASRVDNTLFYVYDVAGNEFADIINISGNMSYGESVLEKISRELLLGWNRDFLCEQISLIEYIEESVGKKRLEIEGRVFQRIQKLVGDPLSPSFKYEENIYPNPYYFLKNSKGPLMRKISAVKGKIHGDLNRNNIIISRNIIDKNYEIYLIDYSHYKNNGYLFNDHAYLQLDLLLSADAIANVYEWNSKVEHDLIIEETKNVKFNFRFINYIRDGIITFIRKFQPNNEANCWLQYWCAQVSAGLNWMNKKGLDDKKQALCLLYASICLKEILQLLRYDIGKETNTALTLLGSSTEREIWKALDKLNIDENRYILISSCNSNHINIDNFASLASIKWEGIFEITTSTNNEIRDDSLPKLKKKYGIQYKFFPEERNNIAYELAPYWCTIQIPQAVNAKIWYKKNIQNQIENLVKSILSIRENYPIYIIVDAWEMNLKIIEEILTEIQINAGTSLIHIIVLDNCIIDIEEDINLDIECVKFSLENVAKCVSLTFNQELDEKRIRLPKKGGKVYLEDEESNYVSVDFDIIHSSLGWNETSGDGGIAFYRGSEPSWKDIAEHRDIDREDYICGWKKSINDRMQGIGSNTVIACNLFHRAGAGGTTLSKRILWDFHTIYPCLIMKKIGLGTIERLKLIYDRTKMPILIVAEITAGNITYIDISNMRIELINKAIRALFICVSRMHNMEAMRHPNNFYLASTLEMTMGEEECGKMYTAYKQMTMESSCLENLYKLTYGTEKEWESLRQPFFYGLFAFDKDYTNVQGFVKKGMQSIDSKMQELVIMLAFMTKYSQIGLNKVDIEKLFDIKIEKFTETDLAEVNPLIVNKSIGYQICHPIIAEQILVEVWGNENYLDMLFEYSIKFIDMITNIYSSESIRLSDILEEIFTHREYYIDEEKRKFSNLVMEFGDDQTKRNIFEHLIKKLPENPHYYNHLARVYIYPSEKGNVFDFNKATEIAICAIEKSELNKNEGAGIHHHLLGKIYTKECKVIIANSKFRSSVMNLWKRIKPIYQSAEIEFSKCMTGNNIGFGLVGKMELISGILKKISDSKSSSINAILTREPELKYELVDLIREMHAISVEYTMKFGLENIAYKRAMTDFYQAIGNVKNLKRQLSLKNLTLKERIYTRRALAALEIWSEGENNTSLFQMSEERLNRIFELINQNICESGEVSRYDRVMWLRIYMRMKNFNVYEAYNFLLDWPDGDRDYFVCFYRYVFGFILYYRGHIDFGTVEKHLKQTNMLTKNLYGISTTSTRELIGKNGEDVYLIPDNVEAEIGKLNNEEREKYREKHCKFFEGRITDFQNSVIYIKFSLDDEHNFVAKMPMIDNIGGMNVGDKVTFALGFSYSEMRAWNLSQSVKD